MQTPSYRFRSHGVSTASQGLARLGLLVISQLPRLHSRPVSSPPTTILEDGESVDKPSFWINVSVAVTLVVLGGIFAGLTLGLMGQDEVYLQVIEQSGDGAERKNAGKVLRLLKRGKHWVLVTLLLSNVITNETLPIVLDRSLGGGWPAVLSSTVLIVIFGEIIPQSVCVRYGLGIGAALSPFVLALMYIMYPVAYPTALLLDWILGEDHGTMYKKAGLKTLVTLHKTIGHSPADRLNEDEVTIISAVLDLKDKPVGDIMTPIKDVYTMSSDTVLDETTMHSILSAGYSRIPIHARGEPSNFVGMLLVKVLITYDPEDCKRVRDFPLATLPETREETSCLDIVNFFQEGKSHMVLVSETPGENHGALGVVTLEDVIEELIGEEIVDESDVYIDVHKAIRRLNPSPLARRSVSSTHAGAHHTQAVESAAAAMAAEAGAHDLTSLVVSSSGPSPAPQPDARRHPSKVGGLSEDIIAHLNLGPANLADRPRETKSKNIKIKPGAEHPHILNLPVPPSALKPVDYGTNGAAPASYADAVKAGAAKEDSFSEAKKGSETGPVPGTVGRKKKKKARSGSLIERVETIHGIPKTVIETTSSSESEDEEGANGANGEGGSTESEGSWERAPLLKRFTARKGGDENSK